MGTGTNAERRNVEAVCLQCARGECLEDGAVRISVAARRGPDEAAINSSRCDSVRCEWSLIYLRSVVDQAILLPIQFNLGFITSNINLGMLLHFLFDTHKSRRNDLVTATDNNQTASIQRDQPNQAAIGR